MVKRQNGIIPAVHTPYYYYYIIYIYFIIVLV